MDAAALAKKYGAAEEDRLLLRRVLDKREACLRKNVPQSTGFLDGRQQALCRELLAALGPEPEAVFDGGYPGAERQLLSFLADWQTPETAERPLCALRTSFSQAERPGHRDFLGALLGAGIRREAVGDILLSPGSCDILLLPEICPFVQQNLESAGRVKLRLTPLDLGEITAPAAATELRRDTVASPRLDSVLAAGFHLSREKAADLVRSGRVSVNHLPCEKGDRLLCPGDLLSVRGLGRLELAELGGSTRKGRISVLLRRSV